MRRIVTVKTSKRFRAHKSTTRESSFNASSGIHATLLGGDEFLILFCEDGDLPCSAAINLSRTFIEPIALVAESDGHTHRRHAHRGQPRHKKCHAQLRT